MLWLWMHYLLFLLVLGYALSLFYRAVYHRYMYLKLGQPTGWPLDWKMRVSELVSQGLGREKLLKDRKSGMMHMVIFYGFIILQFGALDLIYTGLSGGHPLPIPGYPVFALSQEITVVLVLLATGYAAFRRYGEKLQRLKKGWKPSIVLFFITFLMLSVLFSLGFERVWSGQEASAYAPISSLIASLFTGLSTGTAKAMFFVSWWVHLLILLAFLVYIPQSKHFHIVTAPINIFLRRREPVGRLSKLDLENEEAESFGAGKIEDFTRKQMLDFYACVECGRCTNVCPASNTGKTLSPMHLIVKLRDHLTEKGAAMTSKSPWMPAFAFHKGSAHSVDSAEMEWNPPQAITDIGPTLAWQKAAWRQTEKKPEEMELIGDVMTEEEIWSCTTCRNCEDQCPVGNEHVDKIIDLRRHLVLMQGSVPQEGQRAMQNIERQGNPWGISRSDRSQWTKDIGQIPVPTVKENPDFEILFFIGSMGSYDNRTRKVSRALVRLLHEAGVKFAILGNEEKNSGDTPRRMGNEFLFQQLCMENIETFQKYGVRQIVTTCPHTFNTLKNEYPEFGMEGVEVLHHTQLLDCLVREGRLTPKYAVNERITYHDSCYLGRYNDVYDQPRDILRAIKGVELVEMERTRDNGMCCGAGGGMMWMEEASGKRVNIARVEQALITSPTVISSACPYCLTMMEDGTKLKDVDDRVKARDIAEILEQAVFGHAKAPEQEQ
ncbi:MULTISPECIES: (Fe-S)-binding protein [unclassified Paenibacillus]|uniref:(Fe-S)-binding protein n=1 Tax=unclassified Paenibacillus TaxID=185978 RepID=UPI001AE4DC1E|nr:MULTISPECIES: (Fe-S)-binding protein [unclassified Paenibacillus]MBP1157265.1 Fe-S oxidoreductase [Paenibacillus sp. PvP091]MBP1171996.1 Fe-S oxidoreductase [Paenibacillus sp. PvR098]MBP2438377.1 Fe-S oxidoreductase [Paenibacillus sp. PvP052]